MRIFLLGGGGSVGKYTAELLAKENLVSEIVIAGRNPETARSVATRIGQKATAVMVDATDHVLLAKKAKGYDMVINTAGPDFVMQLPAVLGAIGAGADYCDIAADGLTTEKVLGLSDKAADAGITAVIGIGSYPGLSNLMMAHAASLLDSVDELHLHSLWSVLMLLEGTPGDAAREMRRTKQVNAAWQTVMRWFSMPGRVYKDGRLQDSEPLKDRYVTRLPEGTEGPAFPISTTEPITMPRHFETLKEVSVSMTLNPLPLNDLMYQVGTDLRAGQISSAEATLRFLEAIRDKPEKWLSGQKEEAMEEHLVSSVVAVGRKDGRPAKLVLAPILDWLSTAQPLTVAAMHVLTDDIRRKGVFPPEGCLDPLPFMEDVATRVREKSPPGELFRTSISYL